MPVRTLTFTETQTGVGYTGVTSIPPGARLMDVLIETFTAWTAATAVLDLGDADGAEALVKDHAAKAAQGVAGAGTGGLDWGNGLTGATGPYSAGGPGKLYPTGDVLTAVITPTVAGGPTGISRVTIWYEFAGVQRVAAVA